MSVLVVGSVALDTLKTPEGERQDILGGSAMYFSLAASHFTKVNMVAVVGQDFPTEHFEILKKAGVDYAGLQIASGKTFRWSGSYMEDINDAKTIKTELNVFESFKPKIPKDYQNNRYVFLANIDPTLQAEVLGQVKTPKFVMLDTMNLWIQLKKESLFQLLKKVDLFVLNEKEAKLLTGHSNLIYAARELLTKGPKNVVVKKGEHGAILIGKNEFFSAPAYPVSRVFDPTGAGDSFAGGLMGFLAKRDKIDTMTLRKAMIYGSVMASFAVENFGLDNLCRITERDITARYNEFKSMTSFDMPVAQEEWRTARTSK